MRSQRRKRTTARFSAVKLASQKPASNAVGRTLFLLGDQWTLLILQRSFMGVRRFQDWHRELHLSESVLANRLRALVDEGLMERRPYFDRRTRYEYWLTDAGQDTWRLFVAIWTWEMAHIPGRSTTSPALFHVDCGSATMPELHCGTCAGGPVPSRTTTASRAGPEGALMSNPKRRSRRAVTMSLEANRLNPASETVEVLGDRWITGILTACMFGARRFSDFERELRTTPSVLSEKLDRLVALGMLSKQPHAGTTHWFDYRLTGKGRAIFPVFTILLDWAERWMGDLEHPTVRVEHGDDHHRFVPLLACSGCGEPLERTTIRFLIDD